MCCDIKLNLQDYNNSEPIIVCGRTMEFCEPLQSRLELVPRDKKCESITPFNKLEWISKYGYIGIKVLEKDIVVDGINEVGLSCGILTLDATKYSNVTNTSISILDVCSWLLSNCSNVAQSIELLKSKQIYGETIPVLNRVIGLHIIVHDSLGNSIVCELSENNMDITYTDGIVTNGPYYNQQLHFLDDYRNNKFNIQDPYSSIGRFIKLSELKRVCIPESHDSLGLVSLICHMFNNVDITRGVSISHRDDNILFGITQWCFIKDLTSKHLYYRSYNNMTLHHIDLNTLDFSGYKSYKNIYIDDTISTIINVSL